MYNVCIDTCLEHAGEIGDDIEWFVKMKGVSWTFSWFGCVDSIHTLPYRLTIARNVELGHFHCRLGLHALLCSLTHTLIAINVKRYYLYYLPWTSLYACTYACTYSTHRIHLDFTFQVVWNKSLKKFPITLRTPYFLCMYFRTCTLPSRNIKYIYALANVSRSILCFCTFSVRTYINAEMSNVARLTSHEADAMG